MSLEDPELNTGMVHEASRCLQFFHSLDPIITQDIILCTNQTDSFKISACRRLPARFFLVIFYSFLCERTTKIEIVTLKIKKSLIATLNAFPSYFKYGLIYQFKNNIFLTFLVLFLQRYRLLDKTLLTATKSDAASQYIEWLVILVDNTS